MACKTWVRFLFLLKPHTSKPWGRGGGEGKPRRYQQNDVKKGHVFCLLLFLSKLGYWSFLPEKYHHLREVILKREMPNIAEVQEMGTTEVGLKSRYKSCVCSVDETQIQGQNMWMHTGLHLYIQGEWKQQSHGHFGLEVSQETPAVWAFFSLQCLSSTQQFMTDIFTLRFFRCSIYIKNWSLSNNTSAMVIVFRIMLNEPFSCPTVSSSKNQEIKSLT